MHDSPFQILTLIVAPAILTNSSSILSLGTSNRFARTVDRSRYIYDQMKYPEKLLAREIELFEKQLPVIGQRSLLLVKALTCFYLSVGSFAATALASIIGACVSLFNNSMASEVTMILALICGTIGVIGLVSGTGFLLKEMWLAINFMRAEIKFGDGIIRNPIL